jgi:uncharacterized OsmC-like protein
MSDLKFSISGKNANPTKFVAKSRQFTFTIDEPAGLGGTDQGANPVEFLLAAYAGCLNVMGHIVAKELGFALKSIRIEAEGDLNPAKVFGHPTEDRPGYKQIRVNIYPDADTDENTLAKWLEIIESRCPVNDNLINPTPVKINLKNPAEIAA